MINRRTVLVVGAGASESYGYPLGSVLIHKICDKLLPDDDYPLRQKDRVESHDANMWGVLRNLGNDEKTIMAFVNSLWQVSSQSIDSFLQKRDKFLDVGRAAIAYVLMGCEDPRRLHRGDDNWYEYMFNCMSNGCDDEEKFDSNNQRLIIITFNYDLSLEEFLFRNLIATYGLTRDAAAMNPSIRHRIIHMHGTLTPLHWWTPTAARGESGFDYGDPERKTTDCIGKCLDSIVIPTVGGGVPINRHVEAASVISNAQKIFFLGFGYDPQNLAKLGIYTDEYLERKSPYALGRNLLPARMQRTYQDFKEKTVLGMCVKMSSGEKQRRLDDCKNYGLQLVESRGVADFLKDQVDLEEKD